MQKRIWELDFARGIAIKGVVIYHVVFDLQELYNFRIDCNWEWIYNFAAIFIVLSGISCAFSSNNLTRGLKLSVVALGITIVTYIYNSSYFILFGILHLLAFCILLYHFVLYKMKNNMLLLTGILIIIIGIILSGFNFPWNHLFFLGMTNLSFQSMDYFPIFPWAGFFLIGIFISRTIYKDKKTLLKTQPSWSVPIAFLGRNSLLIYLFHQPIIIAIFNIAFYKKIW